MTPAPACTQINYYMAASREKVALDLDRDNFLSAQGRGYGLVDRIVGSEASETTSAQWEATSWMVPMLPSRRLAGS